MTRYRLPLTLGTLVVLGLAAGCRVASETAPEALPYYADAAFTPQWFASPSEVPADFHAVPAFALTDQTGAAVTEADLDGKLTVANFFFAACPGICPMTMANMKRIQDAVGADPDVVLLSHSVTPERDSVAVLRAFAEQMAAVSSRWHLVTGDREAMYALGKDVYFADEDLGEAAAVPDASGAPSDAFLHTESVYLLDGARRIRGVYNGMNAAAVTQLLEDVRTLQAEARG